MPTQTPVSTRGADPDNPRFFAEVPELGKFTRKVLCERVSMIRVYGDLAIMTEDLNDVVRGKTVDHHRIPATELLLD